MIPAPEKPKFGAPCNHCGLCCQSQICPAGERAFPGREPPCPALTPDRLCFLVLVEAQAGLEPLLRGALGIGTGCSMPDSDTTVDDVEELDRRARAQLGIASEAAP
jgi:hypothetical protein